MIVELITILTLGIQQTWLYADVQSRGPSTWATQTNECAQSKQSPINIESAVIDENLSPILYAYKDTGAYEIHNLQAFVRVVFTNTDAGHIEDPNQGGKFFDLTHMDIHAPSEHVVAGGHNDMEIQLFHTARDDANQPATAAPYPTTLLATSITFIVGANAADNAALNAFWSIIPGLPIDVTTLYKLAFSDFNPRVVHGVNSFNAVGLLPELWSSRESSKEREYFIYEGSYTSPYDNCAEGVLWIVYAHPVTFSSTQLSAIRTVMGLDVESAEAQKYGLKLQSCHTFGNFRPAQPLNQRNVRMYTHSGIAEVGQVITYSSAPTDNCVPADQIIQPWLYPPITNRGPNYWSAMYPTCAGSQQSPIALEESAAVVDAQLQPLDFQYGTAVGYTISNTGAAIEITFSSPPGFVRDPNLSNKRFELKKIVFKTPAEHSITPTTGATANARNTVHSMEMQLVHTLGIGQPPEALASLQNHQHFIVSVMFKAGDVPDHSWLAKFWGYLQPRPRTPDEQFLGQYNTFTKIQRVGLTTPLDILAGLPSAKEYYTYDGSLTTPPCSEQAKWYVYTSQMLMSNNQLQLIMGQMNLTGEVAVAKRTGWSPQSCTTFGNNRPIQPTGTRVVRRTTGAVSVAGTQVSAQIPDSETVECNMQSWVYSDVLNIGPSSWGDIPDLNGISAFPTCSTGVEQSPIAISEAVIDKSLSPLVYAFSSSMQYRVENWQHAMKVVFETSPGYIEDPNLGAKRFSLESIDFHAPSEHQIGTGLREMEAVLMCVQHSQTNQPVTAQPFVKYAKLQVSILFDLNTEVGTDVQNAWLTNFWSHLQNLPMTASAMYAAARSGSQESIVPTRSQLLTKQFDITGILPRNQEFFTYDGSDSTPPCSEGVKRYVYTTPVGISSGQLSLLRTKMGFDAEVAVAENAGFSKESCETFGNNRPTQSGSGRTVKMYSSSGVAQSGTVEGATDNGMPDAPVAPGTTITTSLSDVVQVIESNTGATTGACGAQGVGYQPWVYADVIGKGPSSWGSLTSQTGGSALFPSCDIGVEQSPININETSQIQEDRNLQDLSFNYNTICSFQLENNQRTNIITVSPTPWKTSKKDAATAERKVKGLADPPDTTPSPLSCSGDGVVRSLGYLQDPNLGQKRYELSHIEFHAPSEHQVGSGLFDMEAQFHHHEAIGQPPEADQHQSIKRVAVALLFRVGVQEGDDGEDNTVLEQLFDSLQTTPLQPGTLYTSSWQSFRPNTVTVDRTFNPSQLVNLAGSTYATYKGSVTVPPCTEGVQWYVYTEPIQMSRRQLNLFREKMGFEQELAIAKGLGFNPSKCFVFGNNRPVQAVNQRIIKTNVGVDPEASKGPVPTEKERCLDQPWLYSEGNHGRGPTSWSQIKSEDGQETLYPQCGDTSSGLAREQSPIDISVAELDETLTNLEYSYERIGGFWFENNQRNARLTIAGDNPGFIVDPNLGRKRFDLHNLHFHSPSEHSVNNRLYDMELHIVNKASPTQDSDAAAAFSKYDNVVVTFLFEVVPNYQNPWLENFWSQLQKPPIPLSKLYGEQYSGFHSRRSDLVTPMSFVNIMDIFPSTLDPTKGTEFFTYDGSFTEPPCTEGVKWYVYTQPVPIGSDQLDKYRESMNMTSELSEAAKRGFYPKTCTTFGNNRPTQPLYERVVKMSGVKGAAKTGYTTGANAPGQWSGSPDTTIAENCRTGDTVPVSKPWLFTEVQKRGPSDWGTILGGASNTILYPTCKGGQEQGPLNLESATVDTTLQPLVYRYSNTASFKLINDQSSIRLTFTGGEVGSVEDPNAFNTRYEMTDIIFKTPSEHAVGGMHHDVEMQIFHKKATGQASPTASNAAPDTLAVAMLFKKGANDNQWLNNFWEKMASPPVTALSTYSNPFMLFQRTEEVITKQLDVSHVLPDSGQQSEFFTYSGSLTTPPCSEGMAWYVYSSPLQISTEQVQALKNALGFADELIEAKKNGYEPEPCTEFGNIRPLQPKTVNRVIKMKSETGTAEIGRIAASANANNVNVPVQMPPQSCLDKGSYYYLNANERGPQNWDVVSGGTSSQCKVGLKQSPIVLSEPSTQGVASYVVDTTLQDMSYHYTLTGPENPFTIENNQHLIKMEFSRSPGYIIDRNTNLKYTLTHIEFHTPAEHMISSGRYPAEMILHHQLAVGSGPQQSSQHRYLDISVFFRVGAVENTWLNTFWQSIPSTPLPPSEHLSNPNKQFATKSSSFISSRLDIHSGLPPEATRGTTLFQYSGSTTSPPCVEGVLRYLYATPVGISGTQLEHLRKQLAVPETITAAQTRSIQLPANSEFVGNARPIQNRNGRVVKYAGGSLTDGPIIGFGTETLAPGQVTTTPTAVPPGMAPIILSTVISDMDITTLVPSSVDQLRAAALLDFSEHYGIPQDSIVELSLLPDAHTGGTLFYQIIKGGESLQKVPDSITMTRTKDAYNSITGSSIEGTPVRRRTGIVPDTSSGYVKRGDIALSTLKYADLASSGASMTSIQNAIITDLANTYQVHPSRISIGLMDDAAGNLHIPHTLNMAGLTNSTEVAELFDTVFANQTHSLPTLNSVMPNDPVFHAVDPTIPDLVNANATTPSPTANIDLVNNVIRLILATPYTTFNPTAFMSSVNQALFAYNNGAPVQDRATATLLVQCKEEVCPFLNCARSTEFFAALEAAGDCSRPSVSTSAFERQVEVQQAGTGSGGTYVEIDVPSNSNYVRNEAFNAIQSDAQNPAGYIAAWEVSSVDTTSDSIVFATTTSPPPTVVANSGDDDIVGQWWFWLIIALGILCCCLICLAIYCCTKKKREGDRSEMDGVYDARAYQLQSMDSSTGDTRMTDFGAGAPVDVNYNGEWQAARIVSREKDGSYTVDWGEADMVTRGVHPDDVRMRSEGLFCSGDRVIVWDEGMKDWVPAVITHRNGDGTFNLVRDDGVNMPGVTNAEIRLDYETHDVIPITDPNYASPNRQLVGQEVDIMWQGAWTPGKVHAANPDGSVMVQWDDGTYSDGVDPTLIRPHQQTTNPIDKLYPQQRSSQY
eukprot:TRINITY_DN2618_c4_g1_i1.p1 TRINITY_DN2618_c4_g1~~TRINITY_DN2618_c4_g1_i1.p1  ORF type:complete len:3038 (+),score=551.49 TRINITY_DN2618_c4_g1_i1:62-9115(+)